MPVVLMTGDRSLAIIEKIRKPGITDYLTKPIKAAILREIVHAILFSPVLDQSV